MIELAALTIVSVLLLAFVFCYTCVCVRTVMSSAAYRKRLSGASFNHDQPCILSELLLAWYVCSLICEGIALETMVRSDSKFL